MVRALALALLLLVLLPRAQPIALQGIPPLPGEERGISLAPPYFANETLDASARVLARGPGYLAVLGEDGKPVEVRISARLVAPNESGLRLRVGAIAIDVVGGNATNCSASLRFLETLPSNDSVYLVEATCLLTASQSEVRRYALLLFADITWRRPFAYSLHRAVAGAVIDVVSARNRSSVVVGIDPAATLCVPVERSNLLEWLASMRIVGGELASIEVVPLRYRGYEVFDPLTIVCVSVRPMERVVELAAEGRTLRTELPPGAFAKLVKLGSVASVLAVTVIGSSPNVTVEPRGRLLTAWGGSTLKRFIYLLPPVDEALVSVVAGEGSWNLSVRAVPLRRAEPLFAMRRTEYVVLKLEAEAPETNMSARIEALGATVLWSWINASLEENGTRAAAYVVARIVGENAFFNPGGLRSIAVVRLVLERNNVAVGGDCWQFVSPSPRIAAVPPVDYGGEIQLIATVFADPPPNPEIVVVNDSGSIVLDAPARILAESPLVVVLGSRVPSLRDLCNASWSALVESLNETVAGPIEVPTADPILVPLHLLPGEGLGRDEVASLLALASPRCGSGSGIAAWMLLGVRLRSGGEIALQPIRIESAVNATVCAPRVRVAPSGIGDFNVVTLGSETCANDPIPVAARLVGAGLLPPAVIYVWIGSLDNGRCDAVEYSKWILVNATLLLEGNGTLSAVGAFPLDDPRPMVVDVRGVPPSSRVVVVGRGAWGDREMWSPGTVGSLAGLELCGIDAVRNRSVETPLNASSPTTFVEGMALGAGSAALLTGLLSGYVRAANASVIVGSEPWFCTPPYVVYDNDVSRALAQEGLCAHAVVLARLSRFTPAITLSVAIEGGSNEVLRAFQTAARLAGTLRINVSSTSYEFGLLGVSTVDRVELRSYWSKVLAAFTNGTLAYLEPRSPVLSTVLGGPIASIVALANEVRAYAEAFGSCDGSSAAMRTLCASERAPILYLYPTAPPPEVVEWLEHANGTGFVTSSSWLRLQLIAPYVTRLWLSVGSAEQTIQLRSAGVSEHHVAWYDPATGSAIVWPATMSLVAASADIFANSSLWIEAAGVEIELARITIAPLSSPATTSITTATITTSGSATETSAGGTTTAPSSGGESLTPLFAALIVGAAFLAIARRILGSRR